MLEICKPWELISIFKKKDNELGHNYHGKRRATAYYFKLTSLRVRDFNLESGAVSRRLYFWFKSTADRLPTQG